MATTTISGSTTRNNGATVLSGGNIDTSTNTVSSAPSLKSFLDNHSHVVGSRVLASTGTKWKPGVTTSKSGGSMAYQPTKEDPQFLIRHVASKVNNVSNTVLLFGSDRAGRRAINPLVKTHRYHITSIDYKTGIATKGGNAGDVSNYVKMDGTTAASDDAANPTRAIPGELVYMYGALTPKQDDYKAKTGG